MVNIKANFLNAGSVFFDGIEMLSVIANQHENNVLWQMALSHGDHCVLFQQVAAGEDVNLNIPEGGRVEIVKFDELGLPGVKFG